MNTNKICGYNCEHNKGGVCQTTMCDKIPSFIRSTTENYYQVMNRYYTEEYVKELQQELQKKDNIINEIEKYFFGKLQLYGGGGIAEENYKKIIELKELENSGSDE